MMRPLLALALLLGCQSPPPATGSTASPYPQDADGDGLDILHDCDDDDPEVGPPTLVFLDFDGDGHGNPQVTDVVCEVLSGWVLTNDDCDDQDAAVHPDADEACNGVDDDCDGLVDGEDELELPDAELYVDEDGDGHGAGDAVAACEGDGFSATDGDCDDGDAEVHPGAHELCGTGIDEDCSGEAAVCTLPETATSDEASAVWSAASDEGLGSVLGPAGDLDGDGLSELALALPQGGEAAAGRLVLVSGWTALAGGEVPEDTGWQGTQAYARAAISVDLGQDLDGDGLTELVMGADGTEQVAVSWGHAELAQGHRAMDEADLLVWGDHGEDFGSAVAATGDFTDDGRPDLVLGAGYGPDGGGAVWLVSGGSLAAGEGDVATIQRGQITGDAPYDRFGAAATSIGAADLDGDGLVDLGIGAPGHDLDDQSEAGRLYLYLSLVDWTGSAPAEDADTSITTDEGEAYLGQAVDGGHDLNGDGFEDLIVGGPLWSEGTGAAWILLGGSEALEDSLDAGTLDLTLTGEAEHDRFGTSVALVDDLDDDGLPEVLVGAPRADTEAEDAGRAYLFSGLTSGTVSASDAAVLIDGHTTDAGLGTTVGTAALDGGGAPVLILGAPGADSVYLFRAGGS